MLYFLTPFQFSCFLLHHANIKTENLAEVITNSKADCLIVIGDRNMKNRSCQAKRRGKLVEMDVRLLLINLQAQVLSHVLTVYYLRWMK